MRRAWQSWGPQWECRRLLLRCLATAPLSSYPAHKMIQVSEVSIRFSDRLLAGSVTVSSLLHWPLSYHHVCFILFNSPVSCSFSIAMVTWCLNSVTNSYRSHEIKWEPVINTGSPTSHTLSGSTGSEEVSWELLSCRGFGDLVPREAKIAHLTSSLWSHVDMKLGVLH